MSWAARRRFFILLILGSVAAMFLVGISIATFYEAPSCSDSVKNQNEEGVDCGGSCTYLCTAKEQPPTVLFTKALTNSEGRTDIIASVENKNMSSAAKNVPYRITLYDKNKLIIKEMVGTLDLPPGASVPVFVPGVLLGKQVVTGAFLSIDAVSPQWFSMTTDSRVVPTLSNIKQVGTVSAPRIEAILVNPSVSALENVQVIVLVRDARGDIIAASSTVVPTISAQGQATATFTWNGPFSSESASIEVVPIIPLP
ncbi:MAG: hypothetical protein AAB649_00580 [Patescibacteria group bacterium]